MDRAELAQLRTWVGRSQTASDVIAAPAANLLTASLDRDDPPFREGDALPPNWHRLYFLSAARPGDVGADGHSARGLFLPPVPLPRRMFAGGRIVWHRPLRIGDRVTRISEIAAVEGKQGRSGNLVFVTVRLSFSVAGSLAVEETQDLVYREAASGASAAATEARVDSAPWQREIRPDPVLLFRYSALTFNGHRIHYDYPYVTEIEGYPERIVHGPLIATFLLDLVRREAPLATVTGFSFRAQRPLFCGRPFSVRGWPAADRRSVRLAAVDREGFAAMTADVALAS